MNNIKQISCNYMKIIAIYRMGSAIFKKTTLPKPLQDAHFHSSSGDMQRYTAD